MKIEFTMGQAENLLQLIDIAVKAGGLNVAKPAYDLASLIQESINNQQPEEVSE